jgi:peptide/nickel transport system substrate-binding protein
VPEAGRIGMRINQNIGDFPTLQREMTAEITQFHMFNLATTWSSPAVSPWFAFSPDPDLQGTWNTNRINDPELYRLARAMKETEPGDTVYWDRRWLEFQLRFNYILPELPLYSDLYYDFYPTNLENFNTTPFNQWPSAIQWARLR